MEDYKEQMVELFSRYYSPTGEEYQKKYFTTFSVYMMFKSLVPSGTFTEHTAYEILKELGYLQEQKIVTKEVILVEESEDLDEEKDTEIERKVFCWRVYDKEL